MRYHIAHDDGGFFIADEDHVEAVRGSYSTRKAAEKALEVWQAEIAQGQCIHSILSCLVSPGHLDDADTVDGYNRDDLGESPDY